MTTYPAMSQLREAGFVSISSSMTIEELDCEKRGYRLTKTVLGSGAYAKVKLAYVSENKVEKEKRLSDDLAEKGHNMVGNRKKSHNLVQEMLLSFRSAKPMS